LSERRIVTLFPLRFFKQTDHGQQLKVLCRLGSIRTNLKLDFGFGDTIYPGPVKMDYPTLLNTKSICISAFNTGRPILPAGPAVFQDDFGSDQRNLQLWEGFLNRIKSEPIDFAIVITEITKQLLPVYKSIRKYPSDGLSYAENSV